MKELHVEGPATHDEPASCTGVRRVPVKRLTGAQTGRVVSHEIRQSRVPTSLSEADFAAEWWSAAKKGT